MDGHTADVPPAPRPRPPSTSRRARAACRSRSSRSASRSRRCRWPTAEIINIAGIFVPIAFGTGALGMPVGGLGEFRHGNLMGATFATANACFLFTTALSCGGSRPRSPRRRFRQASNSLASEPRNAWTSSAAQACPSPARRLAARLGSGLRLSAKALCSSGQWSAAEPC
jgi:hypothetical protein